MKYGLIVKITSFILIIALLNICKVYANFEFGIDLNEENIKNVESYIDQNYDDLPFDAVSTAATQCENHVISMDNIKEAME